MPGLDWRPASAADIDASSYGYPISNPFEATLATTPAELRPEWCRPTPTSTRATIRIKLRPEREFELPENFWPVTKMRYRLAEQSGEAPLIFIIAGTGATLRQQHPGAAEAAVLRRGLPRGATVVADQL